MAEVETVRVCHPDGEGFMIINRDDFDPGVHTLYESEPVEAEVEKPEPESIEPPDEGGEDEEEGEGDSDGDEEPQEKQLSDLNRGELVARLEAAGGDLAAVEGSGQNGAVKNDDIVAAIEKLEAEKTEAPPEEGGEE